MFSAKSGVAENLEPLLEKSHLGGQLVGYILLALGGVGFLVRRDFVDSMRRLGLRGVAMTDLAVVVVGVLMLLALNAGGDRVQHRFFPDLWRSDHDMTAQIARSVTGMRLLVFGLTAGVGEEITMRGALQPRLGIPLTALFFASLHVQYSWFGILLVMALGIVLGLIRARTSTTVAMLVHAFYDMLAVFTT
jgi:membrane protease YdiL (CAAX protease family)